ncbi:MAG: porin [Pseudomonadota bacterium]
MIGAHKKATTLAAASFFAGALALSPASAADLGGNCCADLEERVAELEATTVRKGNRKVSLKLSGQVNTALLIWDDGDESDIYVVDTENSSTRFRLTGDAKIKPGWTAGFKIELDIDGHANSADVDATNADGTDGLSDDILQLRHSDIYVKSPYGKLSLGQGDSASNGTSEVDLSGTSVAGYAGIGDIGGSFEFVDSNGVGSTILKGDTYSQLDGLSRNNRVRYDSPSLAGFIFSTSFGEDNQYDFALRYKNKLGDFKVAGAIAYSEKEDDKGTDEDEERINGSVSVFHIPTGLNFTFGAGDQDDGDDLEKTFYYGKVGIKRKWNSLGATAVSVDYGFGDEFDVAGGEFEHFGVQIVQKVDAAAMELYFAYSNDSYEDDFNTDLEDLNLFLIGSRIKF